jgi:hypothetical protein
MLGARSHAITTATIRMLRADAMTNRTDIETSCLVAELYAMALTPRSPSGDDPEHVKHQTCQR